MGGTNVNFVQVVGDGRLRVRTFERGVEAETLACGTGVTASALTAHAVLQPDCTAFAIQAQGGRLSVTFAPAAPCGFQKVFLTGPAERVFTGEITLE